MTDEVGTTYFSYRGPSPYENGSAPATAGRSNNGSAANRNTIRSVQSVMSANPSERGGNNEMTVSIRPRQSSPTCPEGMIMLGPPFNFPIPDFEQLKHDPRFLAASATGRPFVTCHGVPPMTSDNPPPVTPPRRRYWDLECKSQTLRAFLLCSAIVLGVMFVAALFMALHYGAL